MRRLSVIAVLFAGIPFGWNPLLGQSPSERIEPSKNKKQQAEQGAPQAQNTQRGTENRPLIVDIKEHPKSETEAAEDKRINDAKDYRDRWTFHLAAIGTVISGLLLIIGVGGVCAAVRTLRAIESQATLMERQAKTMEDQTEELKKTVTSTERQLELTHRPWISADVNIASDLTFDERGCVLMLNVGITNVGHSVAKHVGLWVQFVISSIDDVRSAHEALCAAIKQPTDSHDYGWMLFPNQAVTEKQRLVIARPEDIQRGLAKERLNGSNTIGLHLIGCIDYQSTFNPNKRHQTRFVYLVVRVDIPEGVGRGAFDPTPITGAFDPSVGSYGRIVIIPTMHGASAD